MFYIYNNLIVEYQFYFIQIKIIMFIFFFNWKTKLVLKNYEKPLKYIL
jgi:hypothetical protein